MMVVGAPQAARRGRPGGNAVTIALHQHPIVYDDPRWISDTSAWVKHIPFAFLLVDLLRPRLIVELGAHKGDSYCAFCQAVELLKVDCRCVAVDTWEGDAHTSSYGPEILRALRECHDPRYAAFSRLLQAHFEDAVREFADGSIDLLHIDGFHTYDAVKNDYDTWLPKMSDRGVILFHDTTERRLDFGVWKLWDEVKRGRPSLSFRHGHGLGVLGVGKHLPPELLALLTADEREQEAFITQCVRLGRRHERRRAWTVIATTPAHELLTIPRWLRLAKAAAIIGGTTVGMVPGGSKARRGRLALRREIHVTP